MNIPFFEELAASHSIIIAGCGGGFDIASGVPIYLYLRDLGKEVILANLSFTDLALTESEEIYPHIYHVTNQSKEISYFPELHILRWLNTKDEMPNIYAFPVELGVKPLREAYQYLINKHAVDTIILVDGGTDSLMFGDEQGVATMVEDSCSIVAAAGTGLSKSYLIATGFGVEKSYALNHYACLENIANLMSNEAYKGAVSLTSEMKAGKEYLEMTDYLHQKMPDHQSLIVSSIASSIKGMFGEFYPTRQSTNLKKPFISPLMTFYWFFTLESIATRIIYASKIENTETMDEVAKAFRLAHALASRRIRQEIPL